MKSQWKDREPVIMSERTKLLVSRSSIDPQIVKEIYDVKRNLGMFEDFKPKNYRLYKSIQNDFELQWFKDIGRVPSNEILKVLGFEPTKETLAKMGFVVPTEAVQ